MAIWPFNRKKTTSAAATSVPPEIQDYYNAQHRERVGVAWLIALGSLLACVAVVVGLFFGGRWAYRQVFDNKSGSGNDVAIQEDTNKDQSAGSKPADKPADANKDNKQPGAIPGGESSDAAGSPAAPPQTSSTNTTAPQQAGKISETGPGDTLAIFAASTVAGTIIYQVVLRRRATQE